MKETITIKATPTVVKMAEDAMQMQDAVNSTAVTNYLLKVMAYFRNGREDGQRYSGGDMGSQNPITIAIINKLNHLAKMDQSREMSFDACLDLANGKDVEWEVDFLN